MPLPYWHLVDAKLLLKWKQLDCPTGFAACYQCYLSAVQMNYTLCEESRQVFQVFYIRDSQVLDLTSPQGLSSAGCGYLRRWGTMRI